MNGTVQTTELEPATVEGPTLPDIRWLVRNGWDGPERVLQQAIQMSRGSERWVDWRDVPEIAA